MQTRGSALASFFKMLVALIGITAVAAIGVATGYYAGYTSHPTPVSQEDLVTDVIRTVKPAVVTIVNYMQPNSGITGYMIYPIISGSGVIVDSRGYIVTNYHVVNREQKLQVVFSDGRKENGTVIGEDSVSDLAVVAVSGEMPAVAQLGDSSELTPGQVVIAIGSPLDEFHGTVTLGIVSGLNRQVGGMRGLIQTDAAINKGNSGGPLLNLRGQVVGINTLTVRTASDSGILEGLGFAVPSSQVREIISPWIPKPDGDRR
ncbi:MAG: trypsin-like peptidase domain-containing protein [Chloroflexi bacterium]|nr:trypsin-like peptidase domain-containing protein [Chloroflexota bacterium]